MEVQSSARLDRSKAHVLALDSRGDRLGIDDAVLVGLGGLKPFLILSEFAPSLPIFIIRPVAVNLTAKVDISVIEHKKGIASTQLDRYLF